MRLHVHDWPTDETHGYGYIDDELFVVQQLFKDSPSELTIGDEKMKDIKWLSVKEDWSQDNYKHGIVFVEWR